MPDCDEFCYLDCEHLTRERDLSDGSARLICEKINMQVGYQTQDYDDTFTFWYDKEHRTF